MKIIIVLALVASLVACSYPPHNPQQIDPSSNIASEQVNLKALPVVEIRAAPTKSTKTPNHCSKIEADDIEEQIYLKLLCIEAKLQ